MAGTRHRADQHRPGEPRIPLRAGLRTLADPAVAGPATAHQALGLLRHGTRRPRRDGGALVDPRAGLRRRPVVGLHGLRRLRTRARLVAVGGGRPEGRRGDARGVALAVRGSARRQAGAGPRGSPGVPRCAHGAAEPRDVRADRRDGPGPRAARRSRGGDAPARRRFLQARQRLARHRGRRPTAGADRRASRHRDPRDGHPGAPRRRRVPDPDRGPRARRGRGHAVVPALRGVGGLPHP